MPDTKDLTWLESFASSWRDRQNANRLPHAVLLTGAVGVGKRAAATWMAANRLNSDAAIALPQYPVPRLEHADLRWIMPADDKTTISIEQIRNLVAELSLTSYAGAGKVAVIEPANAMTTNAANSLLKTLEEPPGDALIILIADRHGRLPATIFSRCQRIDLQTPATADALAWLNELQPSAAWADALPLAGNAPLAAFEALVQLDRHTAMRRDLNAVGGGSASPLEVAGRWSKLEPGFVFDWLARQVQGAIVAVVAGPGASPRAAIEQSVVQRMDRRNLFCYLDGINRLRSQPSGTYNLQLSLERLLIDWSEGLANASAGVIGVDIAGLERGK